MTPRTTTTTPVLRIFDEKKALEFYVDFLGFTIDWQHRFEADLPLYMQVSLDNCVLHLSEHHGDASPGSSVRIGMENVKEYQRWLLEKNYRYARPGTTKTEWGTIECKVGDPFGNRLIFAEVVKDS